MGQWLCPHSPVAFETPFSRAGSRGALPQLVLPHSFAHSSYAQGSCLWAGVGGGRRRGAARRYRRSLVWEGCWDRGPASWVVAVGVEPWGSSSSWAVERARRAPSGQQRAASGSGWQALGRPGCTSIGCLLWIRAGGRRAPAYSPNVPGLNQGLA